MRPMAAEGTVQSVVLAQERVLREQCDLAADQERRAAYEAVEAAMRAYRWWTPGSLLRRVRMLYTAYKFKRALAAWEKAYPHGDWPSPDEPDYQDAVKLYRKLGLG